MSVLTRAQGKTKHSDVACSCTWEGRTFVLRIRNLIRNLNWKLRMRALLCTSSSNVSTDKSSRENRPACRHSHGACAPGKVERRHEGSEINCSEERVSSETRSSVAGPRGASFSFLPGMTVCGSFPQSKSPGACATQNNSARLRALRR